MKAVHKILLDFQNVFRLEDGSATPGTCVPRTLAGSPCQALRGWSWKPVSSSLRCSLHGSGRAVLPE